jgi:ribonucleoside-diphosphate reductase alpha chain
MKPLSANSIEVLEDRYLRKDANGTFQETTDDLFHRVARAIAEAELYFGTTSDAIYWEKEFYEAMSNLLFLPNSPTLMNAGTPLGQLSACFVLPVEDNIGEIFNTLKNTALIQQSGGGTGFNFSRIRPKNDFVSLSGGKASGPVSFMQIFNCATEHIKQGGKRRGANMGILNANHPDIEEFISVKLMEGSLKNFNISIDASNAFMEAVEKNADWELLHPTKKTVVRKIKAKKLWKQIIDSAWQTGDPGLIFSDQINAKNPTPLLGKIECTNPCGEVPLLPFESCNLGSINLSGFLIEKNGVMKINWKGLEQMVNVAIRFLDNMIEINNYILPEIKSMSFGNRKIGLGIMGWADMLIQLGIPYDTKQAVTLAEKVMRFIDKAAFNASVLLATKRGVFANWKKSEYYPHTKIRNATRTCIAPTGTISIIANTSSSIEPLFALAFRRENVLGSKTLHEINPLFIAHLKEHNLYSNPLEKKIIEEGHIPDSTNLPIKTKRLFRTSLQINYRWHILHQIAFQKYCNNAVSKTINLPENATPNQIGKAYSLAWKMKAKGITVFRNNSKNEQVLQIGTRKIIVPNDLSCKVCS